MHSLDITTKALFSAGYTYKSLYSALPCVTSVICARRTNMAVHKMSNRALLVK